MLSLGLLFSLLLLEGGLRAYGFVYVLRLRGVESAETDATVILCIGESTTAWGGSKSYPAQLERLLGAEHRGFRFEVVNGADPGRDSRTITANLGARLEAHHPALVVAMMGANDDPRLAAIPANFALPGNGGVLGSLRISRLLRLLRFQLTHGESRSFLAPHHAGDLAVQAMRQLMDGDEGGARRSYERALDAALRGDEGFDMVAINMRIGDP